MSSSRLSALGSSSTVGDGPAAMDAFDSGGSATLRGRQLNALRQMLRLNASGAGGGGGGNSAEFLNGGGGSSSSGPPQWKVLLFDRLGQDILAPIMNVKALREEGVTLHLLINSDRY